MSPEVTVVAPPGRCEETVVVGVDGSEASWRALAWAMDFASDHGCVLDVVTVWPEATAVMLHDTPGHCVPREVAWTAQQRVLDQVSATRPVTPRVRRHLVNARPVDALVNRSVGRRLLVVGSDRTGRSMRAHHHAIPERCAALARCPLMVVWQPDGTVPGTRDL